ncbi:MAG: hypothetical protein DRP13_04155 [Candidatus Aenigmatarchaeota archaeon]|nr:MAG: hypothetical protein DRP13_04155 [Candidatus Aenigmarchaeota archaeon]
MPVYSHSRLSTFEQCPYKFKLKYIDKVIPPLAETVEAFLGILVHRTLEKLYRDLRFQKYNTLQELLDFYNSEWRKKWNPEIIMVRKEYTEENYRKMGEQYIRNYFESYKPFNQETTIGLEQKIKIALDPEKRFVLQGVIDRLAWKNGVYEIHDYKTSFGLPLKQYLKEDRQLALYTMAVKEAYHDAKDVELVWHFLSVNKEVRMRKTEEELERLRKETIELIKTIEAEREFKPKVSNLCDWCEFRPVCPMWSHIYKLEKASVNGYLNDPGVKLVNKYAELMTKRKEIENEIEKVKEALINFCKNEGCNVVGGSDFNAKVWFGKTLKIPGKNEKEREELEKIIKALGKWEEVSDLNPVLLSKTIENGFWDSETIQKIKRFLRIEEIERVYLRKNQAPGEA